MPGADIGPNHTSLRGLELLAPPEVAAQGVELLRNAMLCFQSLSSAGRCPSLSVVLTRSKAKGDVSSALQQTVLPKCVVSLYDVVSRLSSISLLFSSMPLASEGGT